MKVCGLDNACFIVPVVHDVLFCIAGRYGSRLSNPAFRFTGFDARRGWKTPAIGMSIMNDNK
jgi:hypothetical protein